MLVESIKDQTPFRVQVEESVPAPGVRRREFLARSIDLNSKVLSVLDSIEYRRIDSGEELEQLYRLRYRSYIRNNLVAPNPEHMVVDNLDAAENCYRFGVFLDGELVSTMRFHHVTAAHPVSPAMELYSDILMPRLLAGESFIDPSRLAVDPEHATGSLVIPSITMRIAFLAAIHFATPYCITMIREDHEVFYRRMFGSRRLADPRHYTGAINCVVPLYQGDINAVKEAVYRRFPFFHSTASERRMLFDRPSIGADAPLTVLPTARLFQKAA